jgi:hypothetical protein
MNNTNLDCRIATEFMGWELSHNSEIWCQDGECLRDVEDFSPTTDMNAAYVVLEKIASKTDVIMGTLLNKKWTIDAMDLKGPYGISIYDHLHIESSSLPLAVSLLAEKIMDTPEYMALFKGE